MISKLEKLKQDLSESPGMKVSVEQARDMFHFTDQQMQELKKYAGGASLNAGLVEKIMKQVDEMLSKMASTLQLEMLRLQAMSKKRNEAFEVMHGFLKKMQDVRSSIIANLR